MARYVLAGAVLVGSASAGSVSCSMGAPLSCHNTTAYDTCCLNYPGGHLVQTQFWDTNPATGPSNSWTIHGLWYLSRLSYPILSVRWLTTKQAGPL
jgi:ribonuclease T2